MGASQRTRRHTRGGLGLRGRRIGAGQTGLAIGYFLGQEGRRFAILEAADSIGSAWRDRWDSLTLFTPRRYSGLPSLPFPGDPEGYPGRDEVIAYLERYAETFELAIELNSPVRGLTAEDGRFVLEVDGRTITADQVVVATGPFQKPFVPELANRLGPDLVQMHATGYRKPSDIREGPFSSLEEATPVSRLRRSSRGRTGSLSPSARSRRRCRSVCSDATSSGG